MIRENIDPHWKPANLTFAKAQYPQSPNMALPRQYWVGVFSGARQSGKTFAVVQMIKQFEKEGVYDKDGVKYPMRTILISPTAHANPVYDALKSLAPQDIHLEYSDDLVREILDDIQLVKQEAKAYQEDIALLRKASKVSDISKLKPEEIFRLEELNFEEPPAPRYTKPPVNTIILDDLIGSEAFKAGKSPLTNALLRNRHFGANFAILSQSIKSIPKTIRQNANVFLMFKYANKKNVIDDLYPEVSSHITEKQFGEMYEHATQEPHNGLMIDFTKPKELVFRKGFDTYLSLS